MALRCLASTILANQLLMLGSCFATRIRVRGRKLFSSNHPSSSSGASPTSPPPPPRLLNPEEAPQSSNASSAPEMLLRFDFQGRLTPAADALRAPSGGFNLPNPFDSLCGPQQLNCR